jgi:hypothetical protein
MGYLLIREMSAETVAAMHGAGPGGHQQEAPLVLLK